LSASVICPSSMSSSLAPTLFNSATPSECLSLASVNSLPLGLSAATRGRILAANSKYFAESRSRNFSNSLAAFSFRLFTISRNGPLNCSSSVGSLAFDGLRVFIAATPFSAQGHLLGIGPICTQTKADRGEALLDTRHVFKHSLFFDR